MNNIYLIQNNKLTFRNNDNNMILFSRGFISVVKYPVL